MGTSSIETSASETARLGERHHPLRLAGLGGTQSTTALRFAGQYGRSGGLTGNLALRRLLPGEAAVDVACMALEGLAVGHFDDGVEVYDWATFGATGCELAGGLVGVDHTAVVYVEDRGDPGAGLDRVWVEMRDAAGELVPEMTFDRPPTDTAEEIIAGEVEVALE